MRGVQAGVRRRDVRGEVCVRVRAVQAGVRRRGVQAGPGVSATGVWARARSGDVQAGTRKDEGKERHAGDRWGTPVKAHAAEAWQNSLRDRREAGTGASRKQDEAGTLRPPP